LACPVDPLTEHPATTNDGLSKQEVLAMEDRGADVLATDVLAADADGTRRPGDPADTPRNRA
jgi:hypothetical protein